MIQDSSKTKAIYSWKMKCMHYIIYLGIYLSIYLVYINLPTKKAKIKKTSSTKSWWEYGTTEILTYILFVYRKIQLI